MIKKGTLLRKHIEPYRFGESEASCLTDCLDALWHYADCNPKIQGISANQLNFNVRVCLCKVGGRFEVMVNPEIVWKVGAVRSFEGCESIGPQRYYVKRPFLGKAVWYTFDGERREKIMMYKEIRRVAHEIDHLNGVVISDVGEFWSGNMCMMK